MNNIEKKDEAQNTVVKMDKLELKLETPQDYINLYRKSGCVPFISQFFHKWDYMGRLCRVVHWSSAYGLEQGYQNQSMYCQNHKKFHSSMVIRSDIKELKSLCPYGDKSDFRPHPKYYAGRKQSNGEGFVQPNSVNINNNINIWDDMYKTRVFYFLQYLFDSNVLNYKYPENRDKFQSTEKLEFVKAFIPVLEIDAKGTLKDGRADFFNPETFQDFETADGYVKDRFKSLYGKFYKQFSGNGIYYIVDPLPVTIEDGNLEELEDIMTGFIEECYEIESYFTSQSNPDELLLKNIEFDFETTPGWNSYYKVPYSLHSMKDRFAIPLPPDEYLDIEYIDTYSDINTYMYPPDDIISRDIVKSVFNRGGY